MITVNVKHKLIDGVHFFVANDQASVGLCVGHKDLGIALTAAALQLTKLFKRNHGICTVFSVKKTVPSHFSKINIDL